MPVDDAVAIAVNADQRTALDSSTDPQVLAAIVQHRPELRAAVAMNPATYPALLDWLASLDDPAINAALGTRSAASAGATTPVASAVPTPLSAVTPPGASPAGSAAPRPGRRRGRGLLVGMAVALLVVAGGALVASTLLGTNTRATVSVGNEPWGVAVDSAANTAYVTNHQDGTVSVIDTTTNQVTTTIPVGNDPIGVAVDSAANTAYVTNHQDGTVSVIDTTTNQVTATMPVGDGPWGVAVVASTGSVYVTNAEDGTVSVIDTTTNQVTTTIAVGNEPVGVAVDESTGTVYVANQGSGLVYVIDTATNQFTSMISVGAWPTLVAVNAGANTAYVTNQNDGSVSVFDLTTNQVTATIPVGSRPFGVAVDTGASTAYVTDYDDDTVSVIDTTTNQVTTTIAVGNEPFGVAVDESTGTVYVTNRSNGTVSVLQADSTAAVAAEPAVVESTEENPSLTPQPAESTQAGHIDVFTGEVVPTDVQELLDMSVEEFYQQPIARQEILFSYEWDNPGYYDYLPNRTHEWGPVSGWHPSQELRNVSNPLRRSATWDDSLDNIRYQLQFISKASTSQYTMNEFSGENQPDIPLIRKLTGSMFRDVGTLVHGNDDTATVLQNLEDFYDSVDSVGSVGSLFRDFTVTDASAVSSEPGPDGELIQYRDLTVLDATGGRSNVFTLRVTIVDATSYSGQNYSHWTIDRLWMVP